jgi:predicted amidophosphoribosyltransferase
MEFGTESGTEEPKNALCPTCEQPINRDWNECQLCGQALWDEVPR